jgi:hypothetical protein
MRLRSAGGVPRTEEEAQVAVRVCGGLPEDLIDHAVDGPVPTMHARGAAARAAQGEYLGISEVQPDLIVRVV